jgi:hypothetical protein
MTDFEKRLHWTCDDHSCRVTLRRPHVGEIPLPAGWTIDEGGRVTCAACVKKAVRLLGGRGARSSAGAAAQKLKKAERHEEIRAELLAHPEGENGGAEVLSEVAEIVGTGIQMVRGVRTNMRKHGGFAAAGAT